MNRSLRRVRAVWSSRCRHLLLAGALALSSAVPLSAPVIVLSADRVSAAPARVEFRPPTTAPVLDPFRLPAGIYGPGNRGLEYATHDGARIRAAAAGTVAFSGPVAGSLFVSIDHPGGLRSAYGYVRNLLVRPGDVVRAGDVVALAGGPFHFTVRQHGSYLDPAMLFGRHHLRVRLVAHHRDAHHRDGPTDTAGLAHGPATLSGGPYGPRTLPDRHRQSLSVRATPGRLGVPHELTTGKKVDPWQSSP